MHIEHHTLNIPTCITSGMIVFAYLSDQRKVSEESFIIAVDDSALSGIMSYMYINNSLYLYNELLIYMYSV